MAPLQCKPSDTEDGSLPSIVAGGAIPLRSTYEMPTKQQYVIQDRLYRTRVDEAGLGQSGQSTSKRTPQAIAPKYEYQSEYEHSTNDIYGTHPPHEQGRPAMHISAVQGWEKPPLEYLLDGEGATEGEKGKLTDAIDGAGVTPHYATPLTRPSSSAKFLSGPDLPGRGASLIRAYSRLAVRAERNVVIASRFKRDGQEAAPIDPYGDHSEDSSHSHSQGGVSGGGVLDPKRATPYRSPLFTAHSKSRHVTSSLAPFRASTPATTIGSEADLMSDGGDARGEAPVGGKVRPPSTPLYSTKLVPFLKSIFQVTPILGQAPLRVFYAYRGGDMHVIDSIGDYKVLLAAALRRGDEDLQKVCHYKMGVRYEMDGNMAAARNCYHSLYAVSLETGDEEAELVALNHVAYLVHVSALWKGDEEMLRDALSFHEIFAGKTEAGLNRFIASFNLGLIYTQLGMHSEAEGSFRTGLLDSYSLSMMDHAPSMHGEFSVVSSDRMRERIMSGMKRGARHMEPKHVVGDFPFLASNRSDKSNKVSPFLSGARSRGFFATASGSYNPRDQTNASKYSRSLVKPREGLLTESIDKLIGRNVGHSPSGKQGSKQFQGSPFDSFAFWVEKKKHAILCAHKWIQEVWVNEQPVTEARTEIYPEEWNE